MGPGFERSRTCRAEGALPKDLLPDVLAWNAAASYREAAVMRYELSDQEWSVIRAMLPTKPHGIPRVDARRVLNGIFRVLRSGAP